jgi:hypothetical protein
MAKGQKTDDENNNDPVNVGGGDLKSPATNGEGTSWRGPEDISDNNDHQVSFPVTHTRRDG